MAVKQITLNKSTLELKVGDTEKLTATVTPKNAANKEITWSSSNESVATVSSNGEVTAKEKGKTTITAKVKGTSVEAVCEITVEEKATVKTHFTTNDGTITDSTIIYAEDTEAVEPYLKVAEARKEEIINSETTIIKSDTFIPGETYTGTAYYFSSVNGDDNNDGLSPETPFQSIAKYHNIADSLKSGDAVFFERGSVYRLENIDEWGNSFINLKDGVTYSAYGTGDKPVFTKAIENSAYEDAWELYYEGDSGEKIWKYHMEVQYCAGIIFDEESYATRVMEWPTPNGWLAVDEIESDPCHGNVGTWATTNTSLVSAGEYRSVEEALSSDLTYVTRLDLEGCNYPLDFAPGVYEIEDNPSKSYNGDLYLRCDKGNPGSLYQDIEIIAVAPDNGDQTFDGWNVSGYVLDNLCIKYTLGPVSGWNGGDGVYCVSKNATVRNNYFYQMAEGVTFEQSQGSFDNMGSYTVTGNLMEYCGEGIRISWQEANVFDSIELTDNMILYTGYGFNNNDYEGYFSIELGYEDIQYAKSFLVKDNVCIESKFGLLMFSENLDADITQNVFIQGKNDAFRIRTNAASWTWIMMHELE